MRLVEFRGHLQDAGANFTARKRHEIRQSDGRAPERYPVNILGIVRT